MQEVTMNVGLFELGRLLGTPGAMEAFERNEQLPIKFLARHQLGDFGDLDQEDIAANHDAIRNDLRILSKYTLNDGTAIYIITEADRSATTVLLCSDY